MHQMAGCDDLQEMYAQLRDMTAGAGTLVSR